VAFRAGVIGGAADEGIFRVSGGALETLVLACDVLPGTGGGTADWLTFSRIDLDASGRVAFVADVVGGSVARGVFTIHGGVIQPVALEGEPAPGVPGASFDFLRRNVAIDAVGRVAYVADLAGGGVGQGLFRGNAAVALAGDPLPGTGGGSVGGISERPAIGAQGHVGFEARIFQGVGGRGLFRATPPAPPVPASSAGLRVLLALLLAALGARRLVGAESRRGA